ncbi:hypothetical protein DL96DRAFT_1677194 [Flagelloscypha sp. PMI_526]|nr:hypothetical protein DL96DRAFT_1677194 [Flagelloscypha sp. PMI_526]
MSEVDKAPATDAPTTVEDAVDRAKRAFALKKFEQAVDFYATALEFATEKSGEEAVENVDLYFAYGQALLENAISQAGVLGKDQTGEKEPEDEPEASGSKSGGPILSFSGDAEDVEDDVPGSDPAVDLFANAEQAVAEAEAAGAEEDEDENEEPEDDFNAAWDIFELARNLYAKQVESDGTTENKLKLAECYIALGDVSLETEKFDQAILDYEEAAHLKADLLPLSSRQIAEVHYKLSIVLDLTSGRLSEAITHADKALKSIDSRLKELEDMLPSATENGQADAPLDSVKRLSKEQAEKELKELHSLREDLALKVEELKTSPNDVAGGNAAEIAAAALDKELNSASGSGSTQKVNDLTTMVKKKKKPPVEEQPAAESFSTGKRKVDEIEENAASPEKKLRMSP